MEVMDAGWGGGVGSGVCVCVGGGTCKKLGAAFHAAGSWRVLAELDPPSNWTSCSASSQGPDRKSGSVQAAPPLAPARGTSPLLRTRSAAVLLPPTREQGVAAAAVAGRAAPTRPAGPGRLRIERCNMMKVQKIMRQQSQD